MCVHMVGGGRGYKRERERETNLAVFLSCGDLVGILTTHKSMTPQNKSIQNREQDTNMRKKKRQEKRQAESILVTIRNMTNFRIKNSTMMNKN